MWLRSWTLSNINNMYSYVHVMLMCRSCVDIWPICIPWQDYTHPLLQTCPCGHLYTVACIPLCWMSWFMISLCMSVNIAFLHNPNTVRIRRSWIFLFHSVDMMQFTQSVHRCFLSWCSWQWIPVVMFGYLLFLPSSVSGYPMLPIVKFLLGGWLVTFFVRNWCHSLIVLL